MGCDRHHPGAPVGGGLHDGVERREGGGLPEGPATHGPDEDVVLAPQHALRHAGGPAGVEDVEVVGATTAGRRGRWSPRPGSRRSGPLRAGARCRSRPAPAPAGPQSGRARADTSASVGAQAWWTNQRPASRRCRGNN